MPFLFALSAHLSRDGQLALTVFTPSPPTADKPLAHVGGPIEANMPDCFSTEQIHVFLQARPFHFMEPVIVRRA